eukprot:5559902-Prymnesium_polylepis.1
MGGAAAHIIFSLATVIFFIKSFSIRCAAILLRSTRSARACAALARRWMVASRWAAAFRCRCEGESAGARGTSGGHG